MEFKPLKDILKEEMRNKGLNVQKLAELTDIAPYYIKALLENDLSRLPAAPYVHGYLDSIARVLDIESEPLWQEYQKESEIKRSGESDKLPENRFAQKPFNKTGLVITIVVLVAIAFLIPKIADFLGRPSIEINSPPSDMYQAQQDTFELSGKIGNPQDKLLINDSEVIVNPDGSFQKQVTLSPGCNDNVFEFVVKRFLGFSTSVKRTVCLTTPALEPSATSTPNTATGTPLQ